MLTMSLLDALIGTAELFESIVWFPFRRPGSFGSPTSNHAIEKTHQFRRSPGDSMQPG